MIKINLLKREKKKLTLPDLFKFKDIHIKDFLKERAILIIPAVGSLFIGLELFYTYKLKQEINVLQIEVNQLKSERDKLKKKASNIQARIRTLQSKISAIRSRIKYIEMSKDIILVLKEYYQPFNSSLNYLYTKVPSTVWFDSLSQNIDFQGISVELSFGSYDINSIKNFYSIVRKEFPLLALGEIKKQENENGLIYYVSSIKFRKEFISEGE